MAIDLNSLRRTNSDRPHIIMVYSPEGMGKTSLAASFPAPVFIQPEDGTPRGLNLDTFGDVETFEDVMDALAVLATEDTPFQTVVIDSISKLQPMVWKATLDRVNSYSDRAPVNSIEDIGGGFGKGYLEADREWSEFVEACQFLRNKRDMTVIWIGHAVMTKFDDPETQSYTRYSIDLQKNGLALLARECDDILFIKKDVTIMIEGPQAKKGVGRARAAGGDMRYICTESRPAYMAKNRSDMPDKIMFKKGEGFNVLAPYLPIKQPDAPKATASKKAA